MSGKEKCTKGIEEAHPFAGMSRVNPNAAGNKIKATIQTPIRSSVIPTSTISTRPASEKKNLGQYAKINALH